MEFFEVIEELVLIIGFEVQCEERMFFSFFVKNMLVVKSEDKCSLYDLMGSIVQFYCQQFKVFVNKYVIEYLKNCGLFGEIVQKFGIGYIVDEWDFVWCNFGQQCSSEDMFVIVGMLIENDNGCCYDCFCG